MVPASNTVTDVTGQRWVVPEIDYPIAQRLKRFEVCDVLAVLNQPEKFDELYQRFNDDSGVQFTIDFAYVVFHETIGSEEEQTAFAKAFFAAGKGSAPFFELKQALLTAVVDFFQPDARESIRQWLSLTEMKKAGKVIQSVFPDSGFSADLSGSEIHGNGMSGSSVLSDLTDAGSLLNEFCSGSMGSTTTTECEPESSRQPSTT